MDKYLNFEDLCVYLRLYHADADRKRTDDIIDSIIAQNETVRETQN